MIHYRHLQPSDADSYCAVRLECLAIFPDNFGSNSQDEAKIVIQKFQRFLQSSPAGFIFGAFDDDKLIGILGFLQADRRKTKHRGEIVQMFVHPDYAGQKIGFTLLQKVVEQAFSIADIEQIELSVVANNSTAIKLYEKLGFKTYAIQQNYFKDGDRYWHQQFMQLSKDQYISSVKKR